MEFTTKPLPCQRGRGSDKVDVVRYAILADIHSNLAALEAVLADAEANGGADELWCLGDIVGYGPDPHPCLERLRQHTLVAVAGNHDWGVTGRLELTAFTPDAAAAALWTGAQLTESDLHYLQSFPLQTVRDDFTLVHGSPRSPLWEYLLAAAAAQACFPRFTTRYCLVGHSHIPLLFREGGTTTALPAVLPLGPERLIINPGGVGQPRDGDPRASYALYDDEKQTIYHRRVDYDIAATQRRMIACDLPDQLAIRLSLGR